MKDYPVYYLKCICYFIFSKPNGYKRLWNVAVGHIVTEIAALEAPLYIYMKNKYIYKYIYIYIYIWRNVSLNFNKIFGTFDDTKGTQSSKLVCIIYIYKYQFVHTHTHTHIYI